MDSPEERRGRFVSGILRNELPLNTERDDGVAEVGGGKSERGMEEDVEVGQSGLFGKAGDGRTGKREVPAVKLLLLCLQPITQGHQFIHLRYYPLLLGEGRKWNRDLTDDPSRNLAERCARSLTINPRGCAHQKVVQKLVCLENERNTRLEALVGSQVSG